MTATSHSINIEAMKTRFVCRSHPSLIRLDDAGGSQEIIIGAALRIAAFDFECPGDHEQESVKILMFV